MTPYEEARDFGRQMARLVVEGAISAGNRLGGWLIIGNAGAMALSFSAILEASDCQQGIIRDNAWLFVLGLTTAFLGNIVSYAGALFGSRWLIKISNSLALVASNDFYIRELEAAGITVADDSPLEVAKLKAVNDATNTQTWVTILNLLGALVVGLYLWSAGSFCAGLIQPLQQLASASCFK